MSVVTIDDEIRKKREALGITVKEFADALGLGKGGEKLLREWEHGIVVPPEDMYHKILSFASDRPFCKESHDGAFRFIDLFAGIGGIRIPFQELGGTCVFSSEWDQFAQKTYKVNFGETPSGDITQIESSSIPDFDILLGGFPCQPFSSAGLKKGFADTRGTLFFEIERIIRDKRPKAFLLENLCSLSGHTGKQKSQFYAKFIGCFSEQGKQYILSNFILSGFEDEYCGLVYEAHHDLNLEDFFEIIKVTRDMVVHEGIYWEMQFFAHDDDSTWIATIKTKEKLLESYAYHSKDKCEITYCFETTLKYEKFIYFFIEACVDFIKLVSI